MICIDINSIRIEPNQTELHEATAKAKANQIEVQWESMLHIESARTVFGEADLIMFMIIGIIG